MILLTSSRLQNKDCNRYFTMIEETIHQEDITILSVYQLNHRASYTWSKNG